MSPDTPGDIDVTRPSPARVYDYVLGGKDNYAVDRQAAEQVLSQSPGARESAVENRGFLVRAVDYQCARGIRQFLDLGAGLPTVENTHEVAQRADPDARVVYVDRDPSVLAHARALLGSQDRTAYVHADIRDVPDVLNAPATRRVIDFTQPVGLLAVAVLHFIPDADDPAGLVARYAAELPAGSYVVVAAASSTGIDAGLLERIRAVFTDVPSPLHLRPREEIARMFGGLELVPPGLVPIQDWPAPSGAQPPPIPGFGGMAKTG